MKNRIIVLSIAAISTVVAKLMYDGWKETADNSIDKFVTSKILSKRTEGEWVTMNNYAELHEKAERIQKAEDAVVESQLKDALKEVGYDKAVDKIREAASKDIRKVKDEMRYDEAIKTIKNDGEKAVESFKDSLDYSNKQSVLRARRKKAEEAYSKQLATLKLTIGSGNDGYSMMKRAFRDERDRIVDEANDDLKMLNQKVDDYKAKTSQSVTDQINEVKKTFEEKVKPIKNERDAALKKMSDNKDDLESSIRTKVKLNRSNDDNDKISLAEAYGAQAHEIYKYEANQSKLIRNSLTKTDKLSIYLADAGWTKNRIIVVACVPVVAAVWAATKYASWVRILLAKFDATSKIMKGVN